MMAKLLFNVVLLLFIRYASTQFAIDSKPDSSKAPAEVSDLVSTFLTELGLITLDADEAFGEHTSPEVEYEDGVKRQSYGRPRSDYFSRIRENYRAFQRRAGSLNLKDALSVSSKLFGGNSKDEGQPPSVDASVPSVPVHLQVRSKSPSESDSQMPDTAEESTTKELRVIRSPESGFTSETKVGNAEVKIDSTTLDTSSEEQSEPLEGILIRFGDAGKNQAGSRRPSATKASDKLVLLFSQTYREFLLDSYKEPEDVETPEDTDPEARSRMLGELLHSESAFDKLAKNVLRNVKWALDSDLSPSSVVEKLDDISNFFHAIRLKAAAKLANQKRALGANSGADTKATRKRIFERSIQEPIDSVEPISSNRGNDEEVAQMQSKEDQTEATPAKETILSAYTNNGVLVTLRIGPEAGDPYRFLRRILTSGEVTLHVQMKTQSGAEAPQLGFENGGLPASALYVDLSDVDQRNSFLKTLRKFETDPN